MRDSASTIGSRLARLLPLVAAGVSAAWGAPAAAVPAARLASVISPGRNAQIASAPQPAQLALPGTSGRTTSCSVVVACAADQPAAVLKRVVSTWRPACPAIAPAGRPARGFSLAHTVVASAAAATSSVAPHDRYGPTLLRGDLPVDNERATGTLMGDSTDLPPPFDSHCVGIDGPLVASAGVRPAATT